MAGTTNILIRETTVTDYDRVYGLRTEIRGFGIGSIDGSWNGVEWFLRENPTTSVVAAQNGHITGDILCNRDGRTGCFYHVCATPGYRKHNIGCRMVRFAMKTLQKKGISRISLIAFKENEVGNTLWRGIRWREREDANTCESVLDEKNIIRFIW